jgi:hypothetical protein
MPILDDNALDSFVYPLYFSVYQNPFDLTALSLAIIRPINTDMAVFLITADEQGP